MLGLNDETPDTFKIAPIQKKGDAKKVDKDITDLVEKVRLRLLVDSRLCRFPPVVWHALTLSSPPPP
jgi:hypothetical protein